jgi:hypothetical protein
MSGERVVKDFAVSRRTFGQARLDAEARDAVSEGGVDQEALVKVVTEQVCRQLGISAA